MNQIERVIAFAALLSAAVPAIATAKEIHNRLDASGALEVLIDDHTPREGSGARASEMRTLPAFSRIELRSAETLQVRHGAMAAVRVTGDDNLLELVEITVKDGTLVIESRDSYRTRKAMCIEVTLPVLQHLLLTGSGDAELQALDGPRFDLELDGSGSVRATGLVKALNIELNGSGDVLFQAVRAEHTTVQLNGSGDVQLGHTAELMAAVNGSGDMVYSGAPERVHFENHGSGHIRKRPASKP